ncbi:MULTISPECIES: hypothetical protein [unclassified Streptomyces]|uniref:hypothetical protein n=1 Tax=unclassified Streptomyces TaxID=2593676 RepID=UPI002DDC4FF5|nr:hypothetical protein [Streptomyces sp. NBC_01022]WRZ82633.1 hypothetical protein OG316_21410 [Streptomyces sp. NBC_01022]
MSDLVFAPGKFYDAAAQCVTETCENYGQPPFSIPELYSNAGTPSIECGLCQQSMAILSAILLDPQPEMS